MTTRRQHYVWRKYLEPWTVQKQKSRQLWCLRRGTTSPIFLDTKNVAVERDFYRLSDMQPTDAPFIRAVAFKDSTNPVLRKLNEGWISGFEKVLALQRFARGHPKATPALLTELDKVMIEYQENAYSRMESEATGHLAALLAGDVGFFADDHQAIQFSYFLAHQYFRTKAVRDRIRASYTAFSDKELFDRTWPILRYIFATNVGYSIFACRKLLQLQVLHAAPNMEFITGDQPAVNTHGAFVTPQTVLDELELYYPVSPTRAAIISGHSIYRHGMVLEPLRMNYLNQTVEFIAYEQLFARSDDYLKTIAPMFRGSPT